MARDTSDDVRTGLRQTWGWLLLVMSVVVFLSLVTYEWQEIGSRMAPPSKSTNCFGPVGAWLSHLLLTAVGLAAYTVPLWCLGFGLVLILRQEVRLRGRLLWMLLFMLSLTVLLDVQRDIWSSVCRRLNIYPAAGGVVSHLLGQRLLVRALSESGVLVAAWIGLVLGGAKVIGGAVFVQGYRGARDILKAGVAKYQEWREGRQETEAVISRKEDEILKEQSRVKERLREKERTARAKEKEAAKRKREKERAKEREAKRKEPPAEEAPAESEPVPEVQSPVGVAGAPYVLPPIALLNEVPADEDKAIAGDTETTERILQQTLAEFGIEAEVTNVEQGPVVTRYELAPAPGVRVERISGLSNNLALALKATSVRVQAPIPGKGVVGVEVPNATSQMVFLREIMEGEMREESDAALPLMLGKDVAGKDIVADLAAMPHLLIAGATGAGKTVCLNAILMGLLMSLTPDELRLILVDPKIVEFSAFKKLPHLIVPVVTDPHKATLGLRWAINEMEKRYKMFARAGVRNVESYNSRPIVKQDDMFEDEKEEGEDDLPAKLPYIVIVVDELADLMLVAQADIENCIARLAQLSRAVGIHMILATQRPSVNIITGTIKANFPARVAFQVAQRVDSRTILDANGADKLLGRGDMLFMPPGSNKLTRAQGAMVSDGEISKVVDHIREQSKPSYEVEIYEKIEASKGPSMDTGEDDQILEQAVDIIRETRRASTSSLQRRLRIGYTRAARLMDILEERGVVGPPRGSEPREILIDLDLGVSDSDDEQGDVEESEDSVGTGQ